MKRYRSKMGEGYMLVHVFFVVVQNILSTFKTNVAKKLKVYLRRSNHLPVRVCLPNCLIYITYLMIIVFLSSKGSCEH